MKSVNQLVVEIKENSEDWEWYPTTSEIVEALKSHIKAISPKCYGEWCYSGKVLDIGCGNGSFFEKLCTDGFKNVQKFGIEKSNILAEQCPEDVIMLGSDFHEQTLIDKKVDMIFCNPPYTEYDLWAEKIILQGNADYIALVIPVRWRNSERLKDALERRKLQADIIGTYDFNNAERKAKKNVKKC